MYPCRQFDWIEYQINMQWEHAEFCRGSRCATINPLPMFFPEETYDL